MKVAEITGWLQHRNVKRGLLLPALLYALLLMIVFPRLNSDTTAQLGQVQSYLKGHGFTVANVAADDLAKTQYLSNSDFAAGYPLVMAPLMKWFGFMPSIILVNMLAVVVLLGVCYRLDGWLNPYTGPLFLPLLLVFFATSPLLFQFCAATDLLSLAFFMLSTVLAARIITGVNAGRPERRYVYLAIGVGLTAYLCCFFRYAYYLLMFIPVSVLGLYGMIYKKRLWKSFFIALGVLLLLLSIQLALQSGSGYIKSRHGSLAVKTLHWDHLLRMDNFIVNSLAFDTFVEHLLVNRLHLPPPFAQVFIFLFTAVIVAGITLGLLYVIRKETGKRRIGQVIAHPIVMLGTIGAIVVLVNVSFLVMLSVWFELYKFTPTLFWTYVEETRYYAPTSFFIIFFLILVVLYPARSRVGGLLRWSIGVVLALSLVFSLYQHVGGLVAFVKGRADGTISNLEMAHLISNSRNDRIVFVAAQPGANYIEFAQSVGAVACDLSTFRKINGRCSQPVSLYLAIPSTLPQDLERAMREQVARLKAPRVARVKAHGVTEIYYLPDYVRR